MFLTVSRVHGNAGINDTCISNEEETKLFGSNTTLSGAQTLIPPGFILVVDLYISLARRWFSTTGEICSWRMSHMCLLISISQSSTAA